MMLALLYPRVDQEIAFAFLEFCREGNWYDKIYDITPLLPRDQYSLSILIPPEYPINRFSVDKLSASFPKMAMFQQFCYRLSLGVSFHL